MQSVKYNNMGNGLRNRKPSHGSVTSTLPPEYELGDGTELMNLTPESSTSSESLPPAYNDLTGHPSSSSSSSSADEFPKARRVAAFRPTTAFQIESPGHRLFSLPLPPKPDPIPIYAASLDTNTIGNLVYESLRQTRRSGDCTLVAANDTTKTPLCTTTYRFGCGRAPRMQLYNADEFEVTNKGFATRATVLRTHLGTYEWRYANRQERKVIGAHSLLVLERVVNVALGGGKEEELRSIVALFVRNAEVRTAGSSDSTAGNGGRLLVDLREWMDSKGVDGEVQALAVASCICMMKREVDRRRVHQAIVISGAAGGGS
jgi:hypothetical protein